MARIDRRTLLMLAAGAVLGGAGSAEAAPSGAPIGAIRVTGSRTVTLATLAPMVADQLAGMLAERYRPGLRGGATLVIELTQVVLDDSDGSSGDRFFSGHGGGADALQGHVALIGPRREALAEFPMLATTSPIRRRVLPAGPDLLRLNALAHSFAYWTAGKLG
jgi:hypothetical protein